MKKFTAAFLATILLISSAVVCVSAKAYNFNGDEVMIVLTDDAAKRVETGELKIDKSYFADSSLKIAKVEPLGAYTGVKPNLYIIKLSEHDFENVLKAVKILEKYDDIEVATPVGYEHIPEFYIDKVNVVLKAGETEKVTAHIIDYEGVSVKKWKSSDEKVATVKNGKITALKKGTAKITAIDTKGRKLFCNLWVTSSPKLTQNKKTVSSVEVKKGEAVKVKITGKAKKIDNKYTDTRKAKITSKASAKTITIRGVKKGATTLIIRVNGAKTLKLRVTVV